MDSDEPGDASLGPEIPEAPSPNGPNPEELGPTAPSAPDAVGRAEELVPEPPTTPDPSGADGEAVQLFWKLVLVFNVAVFGILVGPMFGLFLGNWDFGLQLFAVGALAFAYGAARYYGFQRETADEDDD